jgi:hypothetical protein
MREEYLQALFWLFIVGGWVSGVVYAQWLGGGEGVFLDLGRAVSVPGPKELENYAGADNSSLNGFTEVFSLGDWWQPLVYFPLSLASIFLLSQLFFGAGAVFFLFTRGVWDCVLISGLVRYMQGPAFSLPNLGAGEAFTALFVILILAVNLPLFFWTAHMGARRSIYVLNKLRRKPVKPESGSLPITRLMIFLAIALAAGLFGSFILFTI